MPELIQVHCRHCQQTYLTTSADLLQCDLCGKPGGLMSPEEAIEDAVPSEQGTTQQRPKAPHATSHSCPACGGLEFRSVRPDRWVAFGLDRVCKNCNTRYIPPTPVWGGVVMIGLGVVLVLVGVIGGILTVIAGDLGGFLCVCFPAILGCLAIGHGTRALIRARGTAAEADEPPPQRPLLPPN
jgi:hypothetical protein